MRKPNVGTRAPCLDTHTASLELPPSLPSRVAVVAGNEKAPSKHTISSAGKEWDMPWDIQSLRVIVARGCVPCALQITVKNTKLGSLLTQQPGSAPLDRSTAL